MSCLECTCGCQNLIDPAFMKGTKMNRIFWSLIDRVDPNLLEMSINGDIAVENMLGLTSVSILKNSSQQKQKEA